MLSTIRHLLVTARKLSIMAHFPGFSRKLFLLRRRLKQLDVNKQNAEDVDDVKARKSVAEESIKDAQEVAALKAT
ncbi:hypothetical protein PC128_g4267 [Phytophthora cactorum]|nr:hypothetical protein PC120_g3551 [Phytophthora cactorum]KAG3200888.1 hypothetical protein PC128_g4267 [Phytophthora cactorum]KAG4060899.1 hypothetical protein PC123_g4217 [Phytophthora cactorum]